MRGPAGQAALPEALRAVRQNIISLSGESPPALK